MPVPGLVPNIQGNTLSITYRASVNDVDLFSDVGSPAYPVHVSVLIEDGVTIGADVNEGSASAVPAFNIVNFPLGSTVFMMNRGKILGAGGIGGNGDRGRRDTTSGNTFVGGGGGGGAGSSSQGGLHGPADTTSADDGAAGTDTGGGLGGANDTSAGEGGYVRGAAAQYGGAAIFCRNANLVIDNTSGEILAGGDGGEGGYQDGGLPGGAVDAEDGDGIATSVTLSTEGGLEPAAVYLVNAFGQSGYTLTWIAGDTYPSVAGYVREVP